MQSVVSLIVAVGGRRGSPVLPRGAAGVGFLLGDCGVRQCGLVDGANQLAWSASTGQRSLALAMPSGDRRGICQPVLRPSFSVVECVSRILTVFANCDRRSH